MIIQCDKCSTKFRLDDSRITGGGVKVRCTKCQNVFIVTPPPPAEEVQVEEVFGVPGPLPKKPDEQSKAGTPRAKAPEGMNLKFDFSRPEEGFEEGGRVPEPQEKPEMDEPAPAFNGPDPGAAQEKDESKEAFLTNDDGAPFKEESFKIEPPPTPDKKGGEPFNDLDFSFDDLEKKDEPIKQPLEWDTAAEGPEEEKKEPPKPAERPMSASAQAAYAKEASPPAPKPAPKNDEGENKESFSDLLSRSVLESKDIPPDIENGEELKKGFAPQRGHSKRGGAGLIIAALVFILGGAIIYFSGIIDTFAKRIAGPNTAVQKTVEIESINGIFPENKGFGRFFVIEARIKNITDSPQEIKAVTGVIYNDKGEKIASRSVSPGRVMSNEELKNLPKEEILKPFKDPSGGTIPPKGTVPIMVPFIDLPPGLSEYGIDIVR